MGQLGVRQVVPSLKKVLPPTAFQEKKLVFCVNLKSSKFRGEISEAMILGVDHDDATTLLEMPSSLPGEIVIPEGMAANTDQISFAELSHVELIVKDKRIVFGQKPLGTGKERIKINVKDGLQVH